MHYTHLCPPPETVQYSALSTAHCYSSLRNVSDPWYPVVWSSVRPSHPGRSVIRYRRFPPVGYGARLCRCPGASPSLRKRFFQTTWTRRTYGAEQRQKTQHQQAPARTTGRIGSARISSYHNVNATRGRLSQFKPRALVRWFNHLHLRAVSPSNLYCPCLVWAHQNPTCLNIGTAATSSPCHTMS